MRQGNGSELPGIAPNDPRSQSIGIIDVSPTDDRKSVLAGILTQEKLNRKQIAVILPAQNKAFQRPQDFDDLKSIRRKLQAEIVFIVPGGPGLADFARQRRFPVYSTLESFADSLQSEANNLPPAKKKSGGLFGGSRSKAAAAGAAGAIVGAAGAERLNNPGPTPVSVAPQGPLPAPVPPDAAMPSNSSQPPPSTPRRSRPLPPRTPTDEDVIETQPQRRGGSTAGAAAAGAGAGFLAADLLHRDASGSAATTPSLDNQDDWALPPVQSGPGGQSPSPYGAVPAGGPISPLPPTPSPAPAQNNPDAVLAKDESVPGIIDLPRTKRSTTKLPVGGPGGGAESPIAGGVPTQPPPTPPSTPPVRGATGRRSSGYIPAALGGAVVGAAAGTAIGAGNASASNAVPPGAVKSSRFVGGSGFPPQRVNPGGGRRGNGKQRRKRGAGFWLIAALLLLVVSLVVCGAVWNSFSPNSFASTMHNIVPNMSNSAGSTPATVTITPNSQLVQDNYLVHAVPTSTPDIALHQVTLRTVTFKTPDLTKSVTGTGKTVTAGVKATGKITFRNSSFASVTILPTLFHTNIGVDVHTTVSVTVGAGQSSNNVVIPGVASAPAEAVNIGSNGNIRAGDVTLQPCCSSTSVSAVSTAFTGGQDPQNYSFIKTTDVSSLVDPQRAQLLAAGQKGVRDQIKANEQMVNNITCALGQSVDQTVGPDTGGRSITAANVTLVETCTAQVYDQGGEQELVRSLLTQKATGNLGPGYALAGNIMLNPGNSTLNSNDLDLVVGTKGVWVYQFTDAQKQNLLKHIAGKTSAEARTYLQSQTGVSGVKVDISNGGGTLPTDTTQITLKIQSIAGASGGSTTPAPTVTTNGPGHGPAPTQTVTGFGMVVDDGGNGKG